MNQAIATLCRPLAVAQLREGWDLNAYMSGDLPRGLHEQVAEVVAASNTLLTDCELEELGGFAQAVARGETVQRDHYALAATLVGIERMANAILEHGHLGRGFEGDQLKEVLPELVATFDNDGLAPAAALTPLRDAFRYRDHVVYVIYFKRLEYGRFQLPVVDEKRVKIEMESAQLAMLLDGIDLNAKRLARWSPPEWDRHGSQIVIQLEGGRAFRRGRAHVAA